MVCIVCFDVLAIIGFLKYNRYSHEVINRLNTQLWCSLFSLAEIILNYLYGHPFMAEDKSRYNDILYEMDASNP